MNVQPSGRVPVSKLSKPSSTRVQISGVGVTLGVVVGVTEGVGVTLGVGVTDEVGVGVTLGGGVISVAVGDGDGVGVFSGVGVGEPQRSCRVRFMPVTSPPSTTNPSALHSPGSQSSQPESSLSQDAPK